MYARIPVQERDSHDRCHSSRDDNLLGESTKQSRRHAREVYLAGPTPDAPQHFCILGAYMKCIDVWAVEL